MKINIPAAQLVPGLAFMDVVRQGNAEEPRPAREGTIEFIIMMLRMCKDLHKLMRSNATQILSISKFLSTQDGRRQLYDHRSLRLTSIPLCACFDSFDFRNPPQSQAFHNEIVMRECRSNVLLMEKKVVGWRLVIGI